MPRTFQRSPERFRRQGEATRLLGGVPQKITQLVVVSPSRGLSRSSIHRLAPGSEEVSSLPGRVSRV